VHFVVLNIGVNKVNEKCFLVGIFGADRIWKRTNDVTRITVINANEKKNDRLITCRTECVCFLVLVTRAPVSGLFLCTKKTMSFWPDV